jgi:hypothetical protein
VVRKRTMTAKIRAPNGSLNVLGAWGVGHGLLERLLVSRCDQELGHWNKGASRDRGEGTARARRIPSADNCNCWLHAAHVGVEQRRGGGGDGSE